MARKIAYLTAATGSRLPDLIETGSGVEFAGEMLF
jgi:hypothetical protein